MEGEGAFAAHDVARQGLLTLDSVLLCGTQHSQATRWANSTSQTPPSRQLNATSKISSTSRQVTTEPRRRPCAVQSAAGGQPWARLRQAAPPTSLLLTPLRLPHLAGRGVWEECLRCGQLQVHPDG
ncbi:hypothetical protein E2C01_096037 [Portunus trituberculatus]|uniref:Uncharacterized protein n=1 Tax=Portunus trituberculatus TaxID=210409 RepID=A0A5B7K1Z7_PORTR|nr:hypothetical protein [Portunus trituberculatus]